MSDSLAHSGSSGPFGAMMDEYARAAEEFCRIAESFSEERFVEERTSDDPDCVSVRAICVHACGSAWGYANYLRHVQEIEMESPAVPVSERIKDAADVRAPLAEAIRFTEESIAPLRELDEETVDAMEWRVRWGPTLQPGEHAGARDCPPAPAPQAAGALVDARPTARPGSKRC